MTPHEPPNRPQKAGRGPAKAKYASIYLLRVIQLGAMCLAYHFFMKIIGNIATGKLLVEIVRFGLTLVVMVSSSLMLVTMREKYPTTTKSAVAAADRRFGTPLSKGGENIFKALLFGFILLVIGYMTICLFWDPPWLP